MVVYTLTINVEESVAADWLVWMKETFLVSMLDTNAFERYHMFRVLHDTDGHTYTLQFFCKDVDSFQQFELSSKSSILQNMMENFPGRVVYFNTLLEQLHL